MRSTATVVYHGALGPAFPVLVDGGLAGLAYWQDAQPVRLDGPDGPPSVSEPDWFAVPLDGPDHHHQIIGAPAPETDDDHLDPDTVRAAVAAAVGERLAPDRADDADVVFYGPFDPVYVANVDGRLAGVLCWAPRLWYFNDADGHWALERGWYVIAADRHAWFEWVDAPPLEPGMGSEAIHRVTDAAMDEAAWLLLEPEERS